jgi:hypothetical protein
VKTGFKACFLSSTCTAYAADVKHTSVDACKMITRATEMFIESLVEAGLALRVTYASLARLVSPDGVSRLLLTLQTEQQLMTVKTPVDDSWYV